MDQFENEMLFKQRFERYTREYSTLKDATYFSLRDAILLNCFQSEITEAQIASILNISRTPIREAMLQLSRDGLLEINHGKRARIIPLTSKDLSDISLILDNLHTLSIILCIEHADEEDIRRLEETVALISFYTSRKNFRRLSECNTRFHVQIAEAGKNKWLYDIVDRLLSYTAVFREYAISRPGRMESACKEHEEIYKAIAQRDKELALQLIHEHVQRAFTINE